MKKYPFKLERSKYLIGFYELPYVESIRGYRRIFAAQPIFSGVELDEKLYEGAKRHEFPAGVLVSGISFIFRGQKPFLMGIKVEF